MTTYAFLDTETTSLHRRNRRIWDLAYILRTELPNGQHVDVERSFFMQVDLEHADLFALKVGGYWERHPDPYRQDLDSCLPLPRVARQVARDLNGAVIVGAVPSFDETSLADLLLDQGLTPTWNHHLIDMETLAAGALGLQFPWNLDSVLKALNLTYPEGDRHTAIGDARMVRDAFDAIQDLNRWNVDSYEIVPEVRGQLDVRPLDVRPAKYDAIERDGDGSVVEHAVPCVTGNECDGTEPCAPMCCSDGPPAT